MERFIVEHRSIPGTTTATRPCKWRAALTIGGKTWVEETRAGATHALARTLKESGIPDAQFEIHENGRAGYLLVPSFHAWAEWTYAGGQRVNYASHQASLAALRG